MPLIPERSGVLTQNSNSKKKKKKKKKVMKIKRQSFPL
jgi:hypothetical protein